MNRILVLLSFFTCYNFAVAQNVGIGTNNPQSKLHVAGCIRSDTLIGIGVRNLFAAPNGRIYDSLVVPATINWEIGGNANITPANFLGTTNAQDVIFKTNNTENMRILNANGNIGIGTAAPGNRLEINSALANTSGLRFTNLTSASPTVAANNTALSVNATGDVILVPSSSGDWLLTGNAGTTAGTNFLGTTDAQDLVFKTNNAEHIRTLASNGYVGIGTPVPGAQLEVLLTSNTTAASISRFSRQGTGSVGWMSLFSGATAADWNGMTQTGDKSFIFTNDNNPSASDNSGLVIGPWTTVGNPAINSGIKIMENGNVGISVGAPTRKLEITSDVNASIYATRNFNGISNSDAGFIGGIDAAYTNTGVYFVQKDNISLGSFNTNLINIVSNGATQVLVNGAGNMRVGAASFPTQCGGTTAPENAQTKLAVLGGFSSFGNYNNDPAVNASAPGTTWAGGVGSLILGMNRTAGSSNVDFWNSTDPNNGAAALGNNNRGFNFRNFQSVAGGCSEELVMTLDGDGNLTLNRFTGAGGTANAYAFNTISDQRVKRNIRALEGNMTQKLMELKPVSYQYANIRYEPMHKLEILDAGDGKEETGFLAQELYGIFPQAVHKPVDESKELWSIDYSKLVPVLIKAFQEQQVQIEGLKKEVEQLRSGQK